MLEILHSIRRFLRELTWLTSLLVIVVYCFFINEKMNDADWKILIFSIVMFFATYIDDRFEKLKKQYENKP